MEYVTCKLLRQFLKPHGDNAIVYVGECSLCDFVALVVGLPTSNCPVCGTPVALKALEAERVHA